MLNLKNVRPSFKKGKGVAQPASGGVTGPIPMESVSARLGFKRGTGAAKAQFEFQDPIAKTKTPLERRALMKNVAARVYSQMGWSNRSFEVARAAMLSFNQYRETISPHADDERQIADRLATRLADIVEEFLRIRTEKVKNAADLERALSTTKRDERIRVAKKAAEDESARRRKGVDSLMPEEAEPEVADPEIALDPDMLIKLASMEIAGAESKKRTKKPKNQEVTPDDENATS